MKEWTRNNMALGKFEVWNISLLLAIIHLDFIRTSFHVGIGSNIVSRTRCNMPWLYFWNMNISFPSQPLKCESVTKHRATWTFLLHSSLASRRHTWHWIIHIYNLALFTNIHAFQYYHLFIVLAFWFIILYSTNTGNIVESLSMETDL